MDARTHAKAHARTHRRTHAPALCSGTAVSLTCWPLLWHARTGGRSDDERLSDDAATLARVAMRCKLDGEVNGLVSDAPPRLPSGWNQQA